MVDQHDLCFVSYQPANHPNQFNDLVAFLHIVGDWTERQQRHSYCRASRNLDQRSKVRSVVHIAHRCGRVTNDQAHDRVLCQRLPV